MNLEISFADEAVETLLLLTGQIDNKWGEKQATKFLRKVYKIMDLLSENPYMFKASTIKDNVRIGFISKQTSFFYQI